MFSAIPGSATTQYSLLRNTTEVENTSSQTTQILTTDAEQVVSFSFLNDKLLHKFEFMQ